MQATVWRLSWSKQKRYITLEPISIAYNVLNRLIYCIWDLGKWLNFYASLIPREVFQCQILCTHKVNLTCLIFCFKLDNLLSSLMAPGSAVILGFVCIFAWGLWLCEKRAHVTLSWGPALPRLVWDRTQACSVLSECGFLGHTPFF